MIIETERLILRPWEESDAEDLYEYAKDERVGPIAGWPPHTSVENSREIIRTVLSEHETYAVCLKEDNKAIGSIGLKLNCHTDMTERDDECELGYWLGVPFWGKGLIPEAAMELIRHAFTDLGMRTVWCGYYDGNKKSKRVQEKCGFKYHHSCDEVPVPLLNETRVGHTNILTKEDWERSITSQKPHDLVIYIHGKSGSPLESEHYVPLFPNSNVIGFDYRSLTPWQAVEEFPAYYDTVSQGFDNVNLIANSIGAYLSLCSLSGRNIKKAFFISPIADMERLILDMMTWAGVSEAELREKKEIPTSFGETISWEYLQWVREHPVSWQIPTAILYGEKDNMQSLETIHSFADKINADVTVMENGEHWFHTDEQMKFLDQWIMASNAWTG